MAELNLKQITDKLNGEFVGDARKLVFWYDANADFADEISNLKLDNAKVLVMEPNSAPSIFWSARTQPPIILYTRPLQNLPFGTTIWRIPFAILRSSLQTVFP